MSSDFSRSQWLALGGWYGGQSGRRCAAAERQLLGALLPGLYGVTLAYLGPVAAGDLLALSPANRCHQFEVCSTDAEAGASLPSALRPDGRVEPLRLPFRNDAVDVIVVAHLLEFMSRPPRLIAELRRVLSPGGHLVVIGFNPLSPWGLLRWAGGHVDRVSGLPGSPPLAAASVRRWLLEQHFEVLQARRQTFSLERRPLWGGSYALVGCKRVIPPTLVRPQWRPLRVPALGKGLSSEGKARVYHG